MATLDTTLTAAQCLLINDNRRAGGGFYLKITPADFQERLRELERAALQAEFDAIWATLTKEEQEIYNACFRPEP